MAFQKAQRKRAFIKLAITGPSGSGKTYSALRLAGGLGKKIALIDSENGSGSLYAGQFEYDTQEIAPPFTVQRYTQAISEAVEAGYEVLIVDSLSHAWAGDGGLLAQKEALDARGGNSFTNWATITKQHEAFKASILQAPIHLIATMRSKTEYVIEQGGGKAQPKKVGLAPIQRDGIEFEFTTVFDIAADHTAITTKDRTGLFDGLNSLLTEEHGKKIAGWLNGATPAPAPTPRPARERVAEVMEAAAAPAESLIKQPNGAAAPEPAPEPEQGTDYWRRRLFAVYAEVRGQQEKETMRADLGGILGRKLDSRAQMSAEEMAKCVGVLEAEGKPEPAAEAPAATNGGGGMTCAADGCGKPLTKGQHDISMRAFGSPFCPACQKTQAHAA